MLTLLTFISTVFSNTETDSDRLGNLWNASFYSNRSLPDSVLILKDYNFVIYSFPGSSAGEESACNAGDPGSIPGLGGSPGEDIGYPLQYSQTSLVVQMVKNSPAIRETCVWFLGWEDSPGAGHGNSLQYSCLENPHGQRSLAGYNPWGCKESDMTEWLSTASLLRNIASFLRYHA